MITEIARMPLDLQTLIRLAGARKREGIGPQATLEAVLADGAVRLTADDQQILDRFATYGPIAQALAGFLDATKPAFIEHVRQTLPSEIAEELVAEIERNKGGSIVEAVSEVFTFAKSIT